MIKEYDLRKEFCPFCGDRTYDNAAIVGYIKGCDDYYTDHCCSVCHSWWFNEIEGPINDVYMIQRIRKYGDLNKLKPEIALYVVAMRGLRVKRYDKKVLC